MSLESKIPGVKITELAFFHDERGSVSELWRVDSEPLWRCPKPQMGYVGYTLPGIGRGPHMHVWQQDLFVFLGPATYEVHLWDRRGKGYTDALTLEESLATHEVWHLGGAVPSSLLIPPYVVHGYINISSVTGMTLNYPSELYRGWHKLDEVDEVRWEKMPDNPYHMK